MLLNYYYILLIFSNLINVLSWGPLAHNIIGNIADKYIINKNKILLKNILNEEFKDICNWADNVKRFEEFKWTYDFHFINFDSMNKIKNNDFYYDNNHCNLYYSENKMHIICDNTIDNEDINLYNAINLYKEQITNNVNRNISIRFFSHLISDLHQPFHCGFKDDYGGNLVRVTYKNTIMSLHYFYDVVIIDYIVNNYFNSDINKYINYLCENLDNNRYGKITVDKNNLQLVDIINDNRKIINSLYFPNNTVIHEKYIRSKIYNINKNIAKAGYRLGKLMNNLL